MYPSKSTPKMKTFLSLFLVTVLSPLVFTGFSTERPSDLIQRGEIVFEDNFNRQSSGGMGNGWFVNNKNGAEQATFREGVLVIEMAPDAGHSTVVRHDIPFDDGVVKLKFKLFDQRGLKVNFNDPAVKNITWAGHVARVVLQPGKVTISDDMTGVYELGIRSKRLDKSLPAEEQREVKEFIASKQPIFKAPIELEQWHEMTLVNIGSTFEVYIDAKSVGSFSSLGLDHKVKQNVSLGVFGKVEVDDLSVWSLD